MTNAGLAKRQCHLFMNKTFTSHALDAGQLCTAASGNRHALSLCIKTT